ncbi:MAG: ABC transporter substrate-binding protein [Melioribacteraceae bacterium]|nr:ABC transporter substrate-binding protein [Melioribacteraceae bacterium]
MKKTSTVLLMAVLSFCLFVSPFVVLAGPTEQVKPTLDKILTVLSDTQLKGDDHKIERRAKVMEIIKKRFDFHEMSRRVLGNTWKEISHDDQEHFTKLMTKLLENVYIGKLESYSGQKIEYIDEKIKGDKALVSTTIENNNKKIPLYYILINTSSKWMVYDINIDGVSLVKNYREQFKSVLKRDRFSGLVKELEQMNKDLAGGNENI